MWQESGEPEDEMPTVDRRAVRLHDIQRDELMGYWVKVFH